MSVCMYTPGQYVCMCTYACVCIQNQQHCCHAKHVFLSCCYRVAKLTIQHSKEGCANIAAKLNPKLNLEKKLLKRAASAPR